MTGKQSTDAEKLTKPVGDDVLQALGHLAPERAGDLNALIATLSLDTMSFESGSANFAARVKGTEIVVTYSALLSLWATALAAVVIGTEGMKALREGREALDALPGKPISEALQLVRVAKDLIRDPAAVWPGHLPVPTGGAANDTVEHLAYQMFLAAAGWINLHEIAHFELRHELDSTDALIKQQEYAADAWATEWVLNSCPPKEFEFRIFAVAVVFAWIGLVDDVRQGSVDHPHAWDRFERCTWKFGSGLTELSPGLELATYVIKAMFLPNEDLGILETPETAFFETLFALSRLPR